MMMFNLVMMVFCVGVFIGSVIAVVEKTERKQTLLCSFLTLLQQIAYYIWLHAREWPLPLVVVLISMTQMFVLFQVLLHEKDRQAHWTINRVLVLRIVNSAVYTGLGWMFLHALMSSAGHAAHG